MSTPTLPKKIQRPKRTIKLLPTLPWPSNDFFSREKFAGFGISEKNEPTKDHHLHSQSIRSTKWIHPRSLTAKASEKWWFCKMILSFSGLRGELLNLRWVWMMCPINYSIWKLLPLLQLLPRYCFFKPPTRSPTSTPSTHRLSQVTLLGGEM